MKNKRFQPFSLTIRNKSVVFVDFFQIIILLFITATEAKIGHFHCNFFTHYTKRCYIFPSTTHLHSLKWKLLQNTQTQNVK